MVARKAGPKTRTKQQMVDLGYTLVGMYPKHKYRIILPKSKETGDSDIMGRPKVFSADGATLL
jgi:hypothetical protein